MVQLYRVMYTVCRCVASGMQVSGMQVSGMQVLLNCP
jgi:hypothetical protein